MASGCIRSRPLDADAAALGDARGFLDHDVEERLALAGRSGPSRICQAPTRRLRNCRLADVRPQAERGLGRRSELTLTHFFRYRQSLISSILPRHCDVGGRFQAGFAARIRLPVFGRNRRHRVSVASDELLCPETQGRSRTSGKVGRKNHSSGSVACWNLGANLLLNLCYLGD